MDRKRRLQSADFRIASNADMYFRHIPLPVVLPQRFKVVVYGHLDIRQGESALMEYGVHQHWGSKYEYRITKQNNMIKHMTGRKT